MGTKAAINLSNTDYTDLGLWKPLPVTSIVPSINVTDSNAKEFGLVFAYNDVRGDVEAYSNASTIAAGSIAIDALENAVIRAFTDLSDKRWGRSSASRRADACRCWWAGPACTSVLYATGWRCQTFRPTLPFATRSKSAPASMAGRHYNLSSNGSIPTHAARSR